MERQSSDHGVNSNPPHFGITDEMRDHGNDNYALRALQDANYIFFNIEREGARPDRPRPSDSIYQFTADFRSVIYLRDEGRRRVQAGLTGYQWLDNPDNIASYRTFFERTPSVDPPDGIDPDIPVGLLPRELFGGTYETMAGADPDDFNFSLTRTPATLTDSNSGPRPYSMEIMFDIPLRVIREGDDPKTDVMFDDSESIKAMCRGDSDQVPGRYLRMKVKLGFEIVRYAVSERTMSYAVKISEYKLTARNSSRQIKILELRDFCIKEDAYALFTFDVPKRSRPVRKSIVIRRDKGRKSSSAPTVADLISRVRNHVQWKASVSRPLTSFRRSSLVGA